MSRKRRAAARARPVERATSLSVSAGLSASKARITARPRWRDCTKSVSRSAGPTPAARPAASAAEIAVVWARTDEGVRGFLVPKGTKGFTTQDIHKKMSLRASITSELLLDDVRLPQSAMLPEATSLKGPL